MARLVHLPRSRQLTVRGVEKARQRIGEGPPSPRAPCRARVAPRVRSCDRRIQMLCGGAGARAARAAQLTSSHLPCASCRRGCHKEGAARPERATRAIMVRAASASAHPPCTVGGGLLFAHKFAGFPRTARILNMVPGARGLALASMMAPLMRRTHIRREPCRLVSHRSLHPPRPRPLLKRVRACFFSCTGL